MAMNNKVKINQEIVDRITRMKYMVENKKVHPRRSWTDSPEVVLNELLFHIDRILEEINKL